MTRVFHHYEEWEDAREGMWRSVPNVERARYRLVAAELMRDGPSFSRIAREVVKEWPISTAVNLSTRSINRKAWLGHAICCMASRCPEDVTREAWHELTVSEQDTANLAVDVVIAEWDREHA